MAWFDENGNPIPGPTPGNDSFAGTGADDVADGGEGDDTLDGGDGNDVLIGGAGDDSIHGGDGDDFIIDDAFFGTPGNDVRRGGAGDDVIVSFGGADTVDGGPGQDRLQVNRVLASENLTYVVDGDGVLTGSDGLIATGIEIFDIQTGDGDDSIVGGAGDDYLDGGDGNDTLFGGTGDDVIEAGAGDDLVIWRPGDGNDTISLGTGADTLDLQGEGWDGGTALGGGLWAFTNGTDTVTVLDYNPGEDFVTCFAEGTRILTARGEVPVETLRAGDLVVAHDGTAVRLQPVRWVGHTRARIAGHPDPAAIAPVLVRAGALAEGVPHRDLRVSPDHALLVEGRLVPAKHLVNGRSIVQEAWREAVTYWHVELPADALLVSEGALTESYLDDGNRRHFDNGAVATLFKDFASERGNGRYEAACCLPMLRDGMALARLSGRIAARAEGAVQTGAAAAHRIAAR